jgi:hypothetical protein
VSLVLLLFILFFLIQVVDATMKDGVLSGLALIFTSVVIFPIVCFLELVQNKPQKPDSPQSRSDSFVISEKQMIVLDGIVYHKRMEQAENSFSYHLQCVLVNLDSPPDSFSGGYPSKFMNFRPFISYLSFPLDRRPFNGRTSSRTGRNGWPCAPAHHPSRLRLPPEPNLCLLLLLCSGRFAQMSRRGDQHSLG